VRYRGIEGRPHYLEVNYTDGDSETMTLRSLKQILQPVGARIPASAHPASEARPRTRSSRRRELSAAAAALAANPCDLGALLGSLMPGEWAASDRQRALDAAEAYRREHAPAHSVPASAVASLLAAARLGKCLTVLDPFGEGRVVAPALSAAGLRVCVGTRARPHLHNALSPSFYTHVAQRLGAIEAIVAAPWPALLDLCLPLAVMHATQVVCCHAPLAYVAGAHPPRRAWLRALRAAGRLFFVHPRDPTGSARGEQLGVWLVILASPAVGPSVLSPSGPWSTVL
jgi:hypothetical protein